MLSAYSHTHSKYPVSQKSMPPNFCPYLRQILADFRIFFSLAHSAENSFAIVWLLNIPPHRISVGGMFLTHDVHLRVRCEKIVIVHVQCVFAVLVVYWKRTLEVDVHFSSWNFYSGFYAANVSVFPSTLCSLTYCSCRIYVLVINITHTELISCHAVTIASSGKFYFAATQSRTI